MQFFKLTIRNLIVFVFKKNLNGKEMVKDKETMKNQI